MCVWLAAMMGKFDTRDGGCVVFFFFFCDGAPCHCDPEWRLGYRFDFMVRGEGESQRKGEVLDEGNWWGAGGNIKEICAPISVYIWY